MISPGVRVRAELNMKLKTIGIRVLANHRSSLTTNPRTILDWNFCQTWRGRDFARQKEQALMVHRP